MKNVYAADLHGNKEFYQELYELINKVDADQLIIGGDLFVYSNDAKKQSVFLNDFLVSFLRSLPIPVSLLEGNTDLDCVFKQLKKCLLEDKYTFLNHIPRKIGGGLPISGTPFITPTPFKLKNFERRDLALDKVFVDSAYKIDDTSMRVDVSKHYLN